MTTELNARIRLFEDHLAERGLDLVHRFCASAFNDTADESEKLTTFERDDALALIVGNTRALWEPFEHAFATEPRLRGGTNPLDTYVEATVTSGAALLGARTHVVFGHVTLPAPLPIQRIADLAGLASLSPSHLSVHPVFGPWIALRAVVVVDADAPSHGPPRPVSPCEACDEPCLSALAAAARAAEESGLAVAEAIRRNFEPWVRIRDVCPEGRAHRYTREQIEYHYGKTMTFSGKPRA